MIGTLYPVALSGWNWGPAVTGVVEAPSGAQAVGGRLHHPSLLSEVTKITQWLLWVRF